MAEAINRPGSGEIPPPKCKAILLCNQAIVDARTGKISIIGVFEDFYLDQMPGTTWPFTVFMQLTDGIGTYEIWVEIQDLQEGAVIARSLTATVRWEERLVKANLLIPVPPLPVEHTGAYDLVVFANKQELDRQQFTVHQRPPNEEDGGLRND